VINADWLAVTMLAVDLLAYAQTVLLHDESGRPIRHCHRTNRPNPKINPVHVHHSYPVVNDPG
jgi:hypothetical protein